MQIQEPEPLQARLGVNSSAERDAATRPAVFAVLVAEATNIGLAAMANSSGIALHELEAVYDWYFREETPRAAIHHLISKRGRCHSRPRLEMEPPPLLMAFVSAWLLLISKHATIPVILACAGASSCTTM